ncbi:MAG: type pilus assembly protein PilN [Clostridia bacterium]|nr:type pilus assembly protein PilN [Clostridia bacterium]
MNASINLLPPEYLRRRSLPRGTLLVFIGGAVLLGLYVAFLVQMGLTSKRLAQVEGELALYEPRAQQALADRQAITEWQAKSKELQRLLAARRRWQEVLATINAALPPEVWLTRLEEDSAKGEIHLAGGSTSLQAIGAFLNNLQGSKTWQAVNLQEVKGNGNTLTFTIQALWQGSPGRTSPPANPAPGETAGAGNAQDQSNREGNGK